MLNPDPVKWQRFEDNNLQELHSFQPEENDVVIYEGRKKMQGFPGVINFDSVIHLGSNLIGSCVSKCSMQWPVGSF